MDKLNALFQQLGRMQWSDYLDIILVAFLIYKLLPVIRTTGTVKIAGVIAAILILSWITGPEMLQLYTLNFIINQLLQVGIIAVVVLFQPELRRVLDHMTNIKLKSFLGLKKQEQEMEHVIRQTVHACQAMSEEKVGALIVFARDSRLDEYFKTGTLIDAQVSDQLLRNLFFPKAALHDGASVIQKGRLVAAGCVLPLSESNRLHADLGTRHRAAIGLSEQSDSVIVVVSEETGTISVAYKGELFREFTSVSLRRKLIELLGKQEETGD